MNFRDTYRARKNRLQYLRYNSSEAEFVLVVTCLVLIAAWVTHVLVTISNAEWLLLIAGAVMAPIGIIHGIGIWFGLF